MNRHTEGGDQNGAPRRCPKIAGRVPELVTSLGCGQLRLCGTSTAGMHMRDPQLGFTDDDKALQEAEAVPAYQTESTHPVPVCANAPPSGHRGSRSVAGRDSAVRAFKHREEVGAGLH